MKSKNIKILFHTICKYQWSKSIHLDNRLSPFFEISDLIEFIKKQSKKNKFMDLQNDKFCFLDNFKVEDINSNKVILGNFISARNQFRPNLINKKTGVERINPKLMTEGDIEKTHFGIMLNSVKNEVYLILEYNYFGVTMSNIIDYFKFFNGKFLKSKNIPKNYSLQYFVIPKDGFIEALKKMKSTKIAEVYFDKQLLGSKALNFSNRLVSIKQDIKLSIGANIGESIKETAIDLFNKIGSKDSQISKIRVSGKDENSNDILIDTSFMNKIEFLKIDKSQITGELNSVQIFTGIQKIIKDL